MLQQLAQELEAVLLQRMHAVQLQVPRVLAQAPVAVQRAQHLRPTAQEM